MARNIEIKARAHQFDELRERAAQLSSDAPLIFRQQDAFYDVPRGRLKLRQFDDGTPPELIFYQRDDRDGPKVSYYTRSPVANADAMHALLATALTTRGIVSKERHVYLAGRTRIHLDRVDGLGDFIELRTVAPLGFMTYRLPRFESLRYAFPKESITIASTFPPMGVA